MSYDVSLVISTGKRETEIFERNYTSNMSPAWRAAGIDIADFEGHAAPVFGLHLDRAIAVIEASPADFEQFEPANRWGSVAGMLEFLKELSAACEEHPLTHVRVSR